jgi:hypothetical protein
MKIPTCDCLNYSKSKDIKIGGIQEYTDVEDLVQYPKFQPLWEFETKKMRSNFCPQCGKPYKESGD